MLNDVFWCYQILETPADDGEKYDLPDTMDG